MRFRSSLPFWKGIPALKKNFKKFHRFFFFKSFGERLRMTKRTFLKNKKIPFLSARRTYGIRPWMRCALCIRVVEPFRNVNTFWHYKIEPYAPNTKRQKTVTLFIVWAFLSHGNTTLQFILTLSKWKQKTNETAKKKQTNAIKFTCVTDARMFVHCLRSNFFFFSFCFHFGVTLNNYTICVQWNNTYFSL